MMIISTLDKNYQNVVYELESELEDAIQKVQHSLFGDNRIYLEVKRMIGPTGGQRNIPDGYLLDLNGPSPRLFVVEVELAAHHYLKHIAVQLLEFSIAFDSDRRGVKKILLQAIQNIPEALDKCDRYVQETNLRNLDNMLELLVFETPFTALVIIDEIEDKLENLFAEKFNFGVEVIQLKKFESDCGEIAYQFDPFLPDFIRREVNLSKPRSRPNYGLDEYDTVVVPARDEGFETVFLGENQWRAIRLGAMRQHIRFIAAYRVAPISSITHIAEVKSIESWQDTGKFVLYFANPAKEIGPVSLVPGGRVKAPQSLRYTSRDKLETSKTLDDVW